MLSDTRPAPFFGGQVADGGPAVINIACATMHYSSSKIAGQCEFLMPLSVAEEDALIRDYGRNSPARVDNKRRNLPRALAQAAPIRAKG